MISLPDNHRGYVRLHWKDRKAGYHGVYIDDKPSVRVEDGEWVFFWWTEGNAACDCNRGIFFRGREFQCGHSRFLVEKAEVRAEGSSEWHDVTREFVE